ncbi:MAG: phosphoribosylformylglycinamidine cyclo-ligase [Candidatus Sericytochromatia bacterium]|nr:phosphoribosylformylglycinamidine cyclo-ligase [Candidatus Sericytochromatia bacterium]
MAGPTSGLTYKAAGVDIDAGNALVKRIQGFTKGIGGFAGLFDLDGERLLVGSTDGVGTKLQLAIDLQRYDTIGQDLVAMCVNDLITSGAKPLFFLDYYATGKLDVDQAEAVVRGIAGACEFAGCRLMGGETAEMPGFYEAGKFDLAGFSVGMVLKDRLIDGKSIAAGDVGVGLPSSGPHANGYSLIRAILAERTLSLDQIVDGRPLGEALLAPTTIYVPQVLGVLDQVPIKGMSHITGGGFENIDRVLPAGRSVRIREGSWQVPPIFRFLQEQGGIAESEMLRTFNCGVGMAMIVVPDHVDPLLQAMPGSFVFGDIA